MIPYLRKKGCHGTSPASRRRWPMAAVNRPKRLFSKNTGACEAAQGQVYALTPARCRKVKGRAQGERKLP